MSRTKKDKINHARFHEKKEILIPKEKELARLMDLHGKGQRFGNKRKTRAYQKAAP